MSDNRVICANGHYYDGSKYDNCPHCAEGMARIEPSVFTPNSASDRNSDKEEHKKSEKKRIFSRKKREPQKETVTEKQVNSSENDVKDVLQKSTDEHNVTRGLLASSNNTGYMNASIPITAQKDRDAKIPNKQTEILGQVEQSAAQGVSVNREVQEQNLSVAFAQATTPQKATADKDKTVGFFSTGGNTEPPVGYLICTAGEDWGTGYPLKSGNNAIGRGQTLDVVIMDPKVSREKQAFVMYEPKGRKFFVRPGEGSGLCYLNGELVMTPLEIQQFDRLTLGDTELMLIVVCCEKFSWEETKNEE